MPSLTRSLLPIAVVKNDKMVSVVEDIMANAYVSGEGIDWFTQKSFEDAWNASQIGTKECNFSLIAMSTKSSPEEIRKLPDAIDILGDFPDDAVSNMNANTHSPEGVADLESELQLNHLRPLRNAEVSLFLKSMQSLNTVCFRGHTKVRKSGEDAWKIRDRGTGHWGPNVYRTSILLFCKDGLLTSSRALTSSHTHTHTQRGWLPTAPGARDRDLSASSRCKPAISRRHTHTSTLKKKTTSISVFSFLCL